MIEFTIPIKLVAASNAREHWRVVAKRAKEQRALAKIMTLGTDAAVLVAIGRRPLVVTITRLGKRKCDSDNLSGSAKYVRDGIAEALSVDDGDESVALWHYAQKIGKEYGVIVRIEEAK